MTNEELAKTTARIIRDCLQSNGVLGLDDGDQQVIENAVFSNYTEPMAELVRLRAELANALNDLLVIGTQSHCRETHESQRWVAIVRSDNMRPVAERLVGLGRWKSFGLAGATLFRPIAVEAAKENIA